MKRPPQPLLIGAAISGVVAFGIFVWFGYFSSIGVSPVGTGAAVSHSALLPNEWNTYRGDVWSVGYPNTFEAKTRDDGAVWFLPVGDAEKKTYFLVQKLTQTLDAYTVARKAEGYADPDDVMIANYPAVKYTIGNGRVEYYVEHGNALIGIVSDDPDDEVIAIMFATFSLSVE